MSRESMGRLERPRPRCVFTLSPKTASPTYDLPILRLYRGILSWYHGDPDCTDDPKVPSIPVRLSLVKLFLELSLFDQALLTLQGIMASDDQEVEAWYLEGWAFYLMAELAHDSPDGKLEGEGLTWEELAKDARDCLETCRNVGVLTTVLLLDTKRHNIVAYSSRVWRWTDTGARKRVD